MAIYINGTGLLSPQQTFEESSFSLSLLKTTESARLSCVEPDYKQYIPPPLLRRMSRMIKMGITSAKICLENAGVTMPGAIVTGTGLGCIEDTEKFIVSILENDEQLLTPTPFIQSTHNTVGGQIALLLGCHAYNTTYVHRGSSFESSLADAQMLLQEKAADTVLVGGIDELTNDSYALLQQLGIYTRKSELKPAAPHGTAGGEGAAFFLLSAAKSEKTQAKLSLLKTFSGQPEFLTIEKYILSALQEAGKTIQDIDLVLTGDSGNVNTDKVYEALRKSIFAQTNTQTFKHYCGEYPTAASFGFWLAVKKITLESRKSVLIYNHFGGADHSIVLLEKC